MFRERLGVNWNSADKAVRSSMDTQALMNEREVSLPQITTVLFIIVCINHNYTK